jgi:hypothetical protein
VNAEFYYGKDIIDLNILGQGRRTQRALPQKVVGLEHFFFVFRIHFH